MCYPRRNLDRTSFTTFSAIAPNHRFRLHHPWDDLGLPKILHNHLDRGFDTSTLAVPSVENLGHSNCAPIWARPLSLSNVLPLRGYNAAWSIFLLVTVEETNVEILIRTNCSTLLIASHYSSPALCLVVLLCLFLIINCRSNLFTKMNAVSSITMICCSFSPLLI